jgi:cytidine deaminase
MEVKIIDNLDPITKNLVNLTILQANYSYPRNHCVRVGAIAIDEESNIIKGSNILRRSIEWSVCAERMVFDQILKKQAKIIQALYLYGIREPEPFNDFIYPCGTCRQIMYDTLQEINQKSLTINIISQSKEKLLVTTLEELLPHPY